LKKATPRKEEEPHNKPPAFVTTDPEGNLWPKKSEQQVEVVYEIYQRFLERKRE